MKCQRYLLKLRLSLMFSSDMTVAFLLVLLYVVLTTVRDHDSIGSVWMESANDRSNDMDSHWDKYEEIELYNDRVDKFFPDSNSTKAE